MSGSCRGAGFAASAEKFSAAAAVSVEGLAVDLVVRDRLPRLAEPTAVEVPDPQLEAHVAAGLLLFRVSRPPPGLRHEEPDLNRASGRQVCRQVTQHAPADLTVGREVV